MPLLCPGSFRVLILHHDMGVQLLEKTWKSSYIVRGLDQLKAF